MKILLLGKKAGKFTVEIYISFKTCNDYSFVRQVQRASVSIMNNIAEGYERNTNKEFRSFLYISKGSCAEVRSMLYLAIKLNYINADTFINLKYKSTEISKLLSGLIKTL